MRNPVKVYGVPTCHRTRRVVGLLQSMNVSFDFFDLNFDRHAAAWVRWKCGNLRTPTLLVGLTVMAEPNEPELRAALGQQAA